MRERQPCVYMLASKRNGTLCVGVTSELVKRIWEHKNNVVEGFTKQHGVHTLVWYEIHASMESAITREKALKEWKRAWKLRLIERENPEWLDLYQAFCNWIPACAGLRRQDAEANIGAADGPQGRPQDAVCNDEKKQSRHPGQGLAGTQRQGWQEPQGLAATQ